MQAGFVQNQDGKMAGEILSVYDDGQKGLALVKLTHIDDSLHQEESPADISVLKPAYLKLPV